MNIQVRNNKSAHKFEAKVNQELCEIAYDEIGKDTLDFKRTFVPEDLRHQGIGHQLVEKALVYAREANYHVKPSCPFVKSVVNEEKPKYDEIIA